MKQKILLLIGVFLFITSYAQASNIRMIWHVTIVNSTESPIMIGGLTTNPNGTIRANCWWTDPNAGSNQLWKSDQPLESGVAQAKTWTTNEVSFDTGDCQPYNQWSSHYMEFKVDGKAVSINSNYQQTDSPVAIYSSYASVMFNGGPASGQTFDTTSNNQNDRSIYVKLYYYGDHLVVDSWHW